MSINTNKRVTLYAKYNKIFPYKSRNTETEIEQTISVQPLSIKRNIAKLNKLYHHQTINELYNSIVSNNNFSYNTNNNNNNGSNNNTITNGGRHLRVPKIKLYKSVINKNYGSGSSNNNTGYKTQISMTDGNENKQLFCLVNGNKYKKKITSLYKHKRNLNMYINNSNINNNNNQRTYNRSEHYRHTFTNQTLSSLCKVDLSLFKLNAKMKDELNINNMKRNTVTTHNTISTHNEPTIKQFIKVLNCSKKQYHNKTIRNYINDMNKDIKREIRKNELFVKETLDSLKRLQRNNDAILNKVCCLSG